jgi:hypothetical protein
VLEPLDRQAAMVVRSSPLASSLASHGCTMDPRPAAGRLARFERTTTWSLLAGIIIITIAHHSPSIILLVRTGYSTPPVRAVSWPCRVVWSHAHMQMQAHPYVVARARASSSSISACVVYCTLVSIYRIGCCFAWQRSDPPISVRYRALALLPTM